MIEDPNAAVQAAFPGKTFNPGDTVQFQTGDSFTMNDKGVFEKSTGAAGGSEENASTTPPSWNGPDDARKLPGAGTYPNYWTHKTRSGHVLMMDDSKGAENITIQHRGGSMIQMSPDGKVQIRTQNGRYDITFGENRMYVTGAQDITIDGAASLTCKKEYNVTAKKMNITTEEDVNLVCRNFNVNATQKIDMQAESLTAKLKKNVGILAQGVMALFSKGGFSSGSSSDSAIFVGQKSVAVGANEGNLMMKSAAKMSLLSKSALSVRADGGKMSVSASGDVAIDADGQLKMQNGASEAPDDAKSVTVSKS